MPERTCIACGRKAPRSELVRVVHAGGRVVLDADKTAPGRGAWLCPSITCLARATSRRRFSQALRLPTGSNDQLVEDFQRLIGEDASVESPGL